ncbi:MAG TPA: hypothetical protein IAA04_08575 [Candidatus Lachnoclostridium pullistercoris]|uniref:Uncharacterized protein n=1 Tax=Candidatus Lachnoclostridium pullistercoris TaxID=2838632 RepID=A0A9D2T7D7_9FIRM|nr:hypothetical protein [Candidatus Lachnoclostridium pullistercoris]
MKERKKPGVLRAVSIRAGVWVSALWLLCMGCFTYGTAQYVFLELRDKGLGFSEYAGRKLDYYSGQEVLSEKRREPGIMEYAMRDAMALSGVGVRAPYSADRSGENILSGLYRDTFQACQTAVMFLDREGNVICQSGDYVYFPYVTEETWEAGRENGGGDGYGWIDLSDGADERFDFLRAGYQGNAVLYDHMAYRLTGYFDGSRFEPLAFAFADRDTYAEALAAAEDRTAGPALSGLSKSENSLSALDRAGLLEWKIPYDHTFQAEPGQELTTIYALYPRMSIYEKGGTVRYQGKEYENLSALLESVKSRFDSDQSGSLEEASQFDLWNMIVFSQVRYQDAADYDGSLGEPFPEADVTVVTAVQASPIRIAMAFLRDIYGFTGAFVLLGFLAFRRSVKKHLAKPLGEINQGMADGWVRLETFLEKKPRWREIRELSGHYEKNRDRLQMYKDEISRLNRELRSAETEKKNDRQ